MTTLREAAQQALDYMDSVGQDDVYSEEWDVAKALRAALEQPEQGPVAWMYEGWGPDCGPYVEFYRSDEMGWRDRNGWTPLYTHPPQRKPLTDEQIAEICMDCSLVTPSDIYFARAIERAHGIGGEE